MQAFQAAEDPNGQQNVDGNLESGFLADTLDSDQLDYQDGKGYRVEFRKQVEDGLDEENSFPPTPMNSLVEGCPLDRGLPKVTAEAILERINRITMVDSDVNSTTGSQ